MKEWMQKNGRDFVLLVAIGSLIIGSGILFSIPKMEKFGTSEVTFLNGDVVTCDVTGWYESRHENHLVATLADGKEVRIPLASVKWVRRLPKK